MAEKHLRDEIILIQELLQQGYSNTAVSQMTRHSRGTIRKYQSGNPDYLCRQTRPISKSELCKYEYNIVEALHKGIVLKDIYRSLYAADHSVKKSTFYDYCKKLLHIHNIEYHSSINSIGKPINHKKVPFHSVKRTQVFQHIWMNEYIEPDDWQYISDKYPQILILQQCICRFREIFNKKRMSLLYLFIEHYENCSIKNLKSFASGLNKDIEAVENAVASPLNNGFLEGNNSRLKMIKRIMYGRAGINLLRAKVIL